MKGTPIAEPVWDGIGIGIGTLGLTRGEVGMGGIESNSVVNPGMNRVTTFGIADAFCANKSLATK